MDLSVVRDLLGEDAVRAAERSGTNVDIVSLMTQAYFGLRGDNPEGDFGRLDQFFGSAVSGTPTQSVADRRQKPLAAYFPGLRCQPWWEEGDAAILEQVSTTLRGAFEPLRAEAERAYAGQVAIFRDNPTGSRHMALSSRQWTVCNLVGEVGRAEDDALFPETKRVLASLEDAIMPGGKAGFIVLASGARLPRHSDATNAQLTCHFPLVTEGDAGIEVAGEVRRWEAGVPVFFDHSYEHEAWNLGPRDRIMLLLNLRHPDVDAAEDQLWRGFIGRLRHAGVQADFDA